MTNSQNIIDHICKNDKLYMGYYDFFLSQTVKMCNKTPKRMNEIPKKVKGLSKTILCGS